MDISIEYNVNLKNTRLVSSILCLIEQFCRLVSSTNKCVNRNLRITNCSYNGGLFQNFERSKNKIWMGNPDVNRSWKRKKMWSYIILNWFPVIFQQLYSKLSYFHPKDIKFRQDSVDCIAFSKFSNQWFDHIRYSSQ